MRLNWGCGPVQPGGWVNSDVIQWEAGQDHQGDILDGLPYDDATFEYVVTNHALQALDRVDVVPALEELRRVTSGWVRIIVPDLHAAIRAAERNDFEHFQIDDEIEHTLDGKLCVYLTQGGATNSLFTTEYLSDLCFRAGFTSTHTAAFGRTITGHDEITELDSREHESIFLEAHR